MATQQRQEQRQRPPKTLLPAVQVARFGEVLDLTKFDPEKYNLLNPYQSITPISPYHIVSVQMVQISSDPEDGDVYPGNAGKVRLSKNGLLKLAAAAGIRWDPAYTGVVYRDPPTGPAQRVVYQAVGTLNDMQGNPQPIKGSKELDLSLILDEVTDAQTFKVSNTWDNEARQWIPKRFPSPEEKLRQVEAAIRKEMQTKAKNLTALAETGAMLRAIRAALAARNEYKPEQLDKPFVCAKVSVNPAADPETAREMIRQSMSISQVPPQAVGPGTRPAGLLGAGTVPPITDIPEGPEDDVYEGDVPDDEPTAAQTGRLL